jgi:hypothetical protein
MKPGDIVFAKELQTGVEKAHARIQFRGHAFAMVLGTMPLMAKEPPKEHIHRLLGNVGYLSFDDVAEFLGEVLAKECVDKFELKYSTQLQEVADVTPALTDEVPILRQKIVDLKGRPIVEPLDIDSDGKEVH